MAAQTGLCLAWSETLEHMFCRVVAHIKIFILMCPLMDIFVCVISLIIHNKYFILAFYGSYEYKMALYLVNHRENKF